MVVLVLFNYFVWIHCRESEDNYWQPREVIPVSQPPGLLAENSSAVMNLLQGFQATMERQLSSIREKLGDIEDRRNFGKSPSVLEKEVSITEWYL